MTKSSTLLTTFGLGPGMETLFVYCVNAPIADHQAEEEGESSINVLDCKEARFLPRPFQGFSKLFWVNAKEIASKPVMVDSVAGLDV